MSSLTIVVTAPGSASASRAQFGASPNCSSTNGFNSQKCSAVLLMSPVLPARRRQQYASRVRSPGETVNREVT